MPTPKNKFLEAVMERIVREREEFALHRIKPQQQTKNSARNVGQPAKSPLRKGSKKRP